MDFQLLHVLDPRIRSQRWTSADATSSTASRRRSSACSAFGSSSTWRRRSRPGSTTTACRAPRCGSCSTTRAGSRTTAGLPAYGEAVRDAPSEPWSDEELLARALALGPDFEPGEGWAYSNTGYLLVRRIVDASRPGGFAGALERELLGPLGLADTSLALELGDLDALVPGWSTQVGDGRQDVRGRYHPRWVGHRTLASTSADQRRFWSALAAGELCDLAAADRVGRDRLRRSGVRAAELRARGDDRSRLARPADRTRRRRPGLRGGHVRRRSESATTRSSPSSSAATSGSTSRRRRWTNCAGALPPDEGLPDRCARPARRVTHRDRDRVAALAAEAHGRTQLRV